MWNECEDVQTLIYDNGSYIMKAGFAGDDAPRAIFPTIVGRPIRPGIMVGMGQKDAYVGDEAQSKRAILKLVCPIEEGVVTNWDDMEKIWHHTPYNELCVAPEEHPFLLTEKVWNTDIGRTKTAQIMFETFNVPAMVLVSDAALALYASGRATGLTINMGEGVTSVTAIYEGLPLRHSTQRMLIGGAHAPDYMLKILNDRGISLNSLSSLVHRDIARDIGIKLGYVAMDFEAEMKRAATDPSPVNHSYELPDGTIITIGNERFRCPEIYFNPSLLGMEDQGLASLVVNCVNQVYRPLPEFEAPKGASLFDSLPVELMDNVRQFLPSPFDLRKMCYANIVLEGGSSLFPGIETRLLNELRAMVPASTPIKVVAPPERKYSTWIGASILASSSNFNRFCVSKGEYDETGPNIMLMNWIY